MDNNINQLRASVKEAPPPPPENKLQPPSEFQKYTID